MLDRTLIVFIHIYLNTKASRKLCQADTNIIGNVCKRHLLPIFFTCFIALPACSNT